MGSKIKQTGTVTKSYKFKSLVGKKEINETWKPAIEEYVSYYNKVSDWICKNLTEMKIGDLAKYIDNKETAYYEFVVSDKYKDQPLYKIFLSKATNSVNHALFEAIRKLNPDGYDGNILGICESSYRRSGYVQNVISNYRTKMSALSPKIKFKNFDDETVTSEILMEQCVHDVCKYGIESIDDFKNLLDNVSNREEPNLNKVKRLNTLYSFFKEHKDEILDKMSGYAIEQLKSFNGCRRSGNNVSMTINKQDSKMRKVGNTSFTISLCFNKKNCEIGLLGNRLVVKLDKDGNRVDVVDICENHGDYITFQLKDGVMYVILSSENDFDEKCSEISNVVGVDVNIKHMMMATSIVDDGNVKGFLNLYKELVNDHTFMDTCSDSEKEEYIQMSESVNFCPIERDPLFSRASIQMDSMYGTNLVDKKMHDREIAISSVFDRLAKELRVSDPKSASYVDYVKMVRAKYKAYFMLKQKYYSEQSKYDLEQGYTDESVKSKDTMDKRRFEKKFIDTEIAKELLGKLKNIETDLMGCRDNIINYAFNVFTENGYDTISLEYLDSSQFDKYRIVSPSSLLNYHKFEGKKDSDVDKSFINEKNYVFKHNENGKIVDIEYSERGLRELKKKDFCNLIIKAIHFADIKDKFVQLANNNKTNIVLVPSAFSSQMDSKRHKLYVTEIIGKKNKKVTVLVDKRKLRPAQERHINGLNSDFNSACNLKYIAENEIFRNIVCDKRKNGEIYGKPFYGIKQCFKKNVSAKMVKVLIENGFTTDFSEANSYVTR